MQKMFSGAIQWAVGLVDADVTPGVAPQAEQGRPQTEIERKALFMFTRRRFNRMLR